MDEKLDKSHQSVLAVPKTIHNLECLKRNITHRLVGVICPFHSALVRPHLDYCVRLWGPQHKNDKDMEEWIQRGATKMILLKKLEYLYLSKYFGKEVGYVINLGHFYVGCPSILANWIQLD